MSSLGVLWNSRVWNAMVWAMGLETSEEQELVMPLLLLRSPGIGESGRVLDKTWLLTSDGDIT
jgi:hypothetical protein